MSEPLVTPELAALVGTVVEQHRGEVCATEFQRYAAAVGDHNPLYFDRDAAAAAGHPDVVMPPMFVTYVVAPVADLADLRPDGIPVDRGRPIPLPGKRMAGGQEAEYHAWAYPGDTLTATTRIGGIVEKQGRSGRFVVLTREISFENQRGELVAVVRRSTIVRPEE
ncbi:MaoC family dehydratase N-terminal domain-containing protein [Dactylosporangium roseum]|uniref:MaoC family dehydratase N-terminal domain-containing protein n=1 Tax=Dactylosporangium roseum TaxID=47989 RepID=A0ABY5YXE0_9ACTN|nr:MaoC family dehydratase N-terminal domain-containing protein [Dactylosporangium roseum]UWZ34431.1 MaoC family dehydratase N-terminal domain-containing protein [Dactylosporangium roseum]